MLRFHVGDRRRCAAPTRSRPCRWPRRSAGSGRTVSAYGRTTGPASRSPRSASGQRYTRLGADLRRARLHGHVLAHPLDQHRHLVCDVAGVGAEAGQHGQAAALAGRGHEQERRLEFHDRLPGRRSRNAARSHWPGSGSRPRPPTGARHLRGSCQPTRRSPVRPWTGSPPSRSSRPGPPGHRAASPGCRRYGSRRSFGLILCGRAACSSSPSASGDSLAPSLVPVGRTSAGHGSAALPAALQAAIVLLAASGEGSPAGARVLPGWPTSQVPRHSEMPARFTVGRGGRFAQLRCQVGLPHAHGQFV